MRIRNFLLSLFACSLVAVAQQTVPFAGVGPHHSAPQQAWGRTGGSGISYVWTPQLGTQYVCLTITNNNPTNAHGFSFQVFVSPDPNPGTPNGTGSRWIPLYVGNGLGSTPIPSLLTGTVSVPVPSTLQIAVTVSGGATLAGSPDTYDISESDSPQACFNYASLTNGPSGGIVPRPCGLTFTGSAATGTQTTISNVPSFNISSIEGRWHVCAFQISGPNSTASAGLAINVGSGPSTCAAPSGSNFWQVVTPAAGPVAYNMNGSPEVFGLPGLNALCFSNAGDGVTSTISINFDYW